ncbi:MAG: oligogalacturonate lyase family protein [Candidatus Zipacnadales bacterium]
MASGDVAHITFATLKDPATGVEVTRLTDNVGDTIFPYFTQPVFSDDGGSLLLSSNRSGAWQAYRLNLVSGSLIQLTDEPGGLSGHASTMLPTQPACAVIAGRLVKWVPLEPGPSQTIYEIPEGFRGSILSPTADGTSVTFAYSEVLNLSTRTGHIYSDFLEHLYRRPTSVVMRVRTDGAGATALWGEREWISHVNVSPIDPDIVVFCHEGPWDLVQRLWVVRASTHEVWPLLPQRRHRDRSGHEYFTASGRLVTQWSTRETPTSTVTIGYNAIVEPSGENLQMFRYEGGHPTHVQTSPDESLWAGDTCHLPELAEGRSYMCLVRHEGECAVKQPLCRHDTSWLTQHSHPHPVFSPDGEWVYFNSDREGHSNVYRAPAHWRE